MTPFDFSSLRKGEFGFEGEIYFLHFDHFIELRIETESDISSHQRRAVTQFLSWEHDLLDRLGKLTFQDYRQTAVEADSEIPLIPSTADIWDSVWPMNISIPDWCNEKFTYVNLELNCVWDEEHGVEWIVRNGKEIMYVGDYGIILMGSWDDRAPIDRIRV